MARTIFTRLANVEVFSKRIVSTNLTHQVVFNGLPYSLEGAARDLSKAGTQLGERALYAYLATQTGDFQVLSGFTKGPTSAALAVNPEKQVADSLRMELRGVNSSANLLFVPIVLHTDLSVFESRHIVWVTVDREKKQIEYYDPKGISYQSTAPKSRVIGAVIQGLRSHLNIHDFRVVENRHQHQRDIHNCGVFGLKYAKARINGTPFGSFNRTWSGDIETTRRQMAQELRNHGPSANPTVPAAPSVLVAIEDDEFT